MKVRLNTFISIVTTALLMTFAAGQTLAGGLKEFNFDTVGFAEPLDIDNQYWPMDEGTIFTYFAETEDGCEWNTVDITYDDDTIDGVKVRVVLDMEWLDDSEDCEDELNNFPTGFPYGDLTEITHDWYAQDDIGNIWYLGEHTVSLDTDEEECDPDWWTTSDPVWGEEGCMEGSFASGVDDAEAGIVMLATPLKGDFYQQEYYADFAEDWGKVLNFIPIDEFDDCLKTKEWTPLERGEIEHKYYCPDEGLLLIAEVSGGPTVWVELIDVSTY